MNGKERVITCLNFKEPDFVPVSDQLIVSKVASEILGRHAYTGGGEFVKDMIELLYKEERDFFVERYVEDIVELHKKLGLDFIRVGTVPPKNYNKETLPQKIGENLYKYEDKETGNYIIREFSPSSGEFFIVESSLDKEGEKALEREIKQLEKSLEDEIKIEDKSIYDGWDKIVERVRDEMAIAFSTGIGIPMRAVYLEAIYTHPEWIEIFLEVEMRKAIANIEEAVKHGADFILGGYDLATSSGPIYNPEIFRKYLAPRYKKILEVSHKFGLPYIYRSDGNTSPFWDMWFEEIGFDGYAEIDASVGIDIGELKRKYGNKIILIGNVDCARTLVYGTKEEIENEVKQCIEKAAKGGRYILASSNSIHYNVPAKNFIYMVEAARKFGKYPI